MSPRRFSLARFKRLPAGRPRPASAFHAAKCGVHVWIMWLEPVPETPPQHACSGARRTALHDKMFSIEKIRRVSAIKRKWLEARKRRERRTSPFPAISYQVVNAEIARARWIRADGNRIPPLQIKIPVQQRRRLSPPRVRAFNAGARPAGRAVPFRLAGQFFASPAGICRGLVVAHVDGPIERYRNLVEHRPVGPFIALVHPECGVLAILRRDPFPPGVSPKRAIFITAFESEAKVI